MNDKKPNPISEKLLNQEIPITFKRREWIVIYNILVSQQYRLGDARIVNSIVDCLQPIVAVDSNIDPDGPITN